MFLTAVLLTLWYVGVFGGNIHAVEAHHVYRSAQLSGATLERTLKTDKIATVINLRGYCPADPWYRDEVDVSKELGVAHVDIALSATHLPPPKEMRKLLHVLDSARYPVLLHCMGGADRSGLASTLYLDVYRHVPLDRAEAEQLTLRYGHVKWSSARRMDQFFDLYRRTSGGEDLRTWILKTYPALYEKEANP